MTAGASEKIINYTISDLVDALNLLVGLPVKVLSSSKIAIDGKYTKATHSVATVTTTSSQIVAANNNRRYLLLINDSDAVIYLNVAGSAAVANQAIRLNAEGGSYEMSATLGSLYTGAIQGIHAGTGNKVLLVTEGV